MPDLFETEIGTLQVVCKGCGAPLEIASTATGLFGSSESVFCMECLLGQASDGALDLTLPLAERIRLIDQTVDDFAEHLRNVLLRCVKPDLNWNREYGIDDWTDPLDTMAAAYGPGIWYAMRQGRQYLVPNG